MLICREIENPGLQSSFENREHRFLLHSRKHNTRIIPSLLSVGKKKSLQQTTDHLSVGEERRESLALPLEFSERTVVRLPSGASSRAKQSGWMLMPMRDTMQGCCRECSMLASWRNSEKFFMASMARRCFSMVSGKTHNQTPSHCPAQGRSHKLFGK